MRRLLAATLALLLLLPIAPAQADWGATRWGMTLDEVLDAVPGARSLKREGTGSDVWDHQRLASAPWRDGEIALTADFFFDPLDHRLGFVKMAPADVTQCKAFAEMLIARYGPGDRHARDFPEMGIVLAGVRWTDPETGERLIYSSLSKGGGPPTSCHFIQQAPA